MTDQKQRPKHHINCESTTKKKKSSKIKTPFFPNSPTSVGSPKDDGARFYPRQVRQRTPKKLCSLVLPPPLISLFDNSGAGVVDATFTSATARLAATASDNASLDGHSILDTNTVSLAPTPARNSSNASAISASVVSVASVGGMGSTSASSGHSNPHLPLNLRAGMAPCDPLLVFDGRFVLVGTCDGRIAIYSIVDFDNRGGISEDLEASERRRRAEWKEEDDEMARQQKTTKGGDEKKHELLKMQPDSQNKPIENAYDTSSDTEEEDDEPETRDRMHRREEAKQTVEPILIVALPQSNLAGCGDSRNQANIVNYDEESTTTSVGNIANPPTIVAICATPGTGTSLIQQRDSAHAEDKTDTEVRTSSQVPTFGKDLLGHAAVLVDDGQVHVLQFLNASTLTNNELQESGADRSTSHAPIVNFAGSFRTGHLGATAICMHSVPCNNVSIEGSQQRPLPTTESVHDEQHLRLCIGHQSGIIAAFLIYSTCIYSEERKLPGACSQGKDAGTEPSSQTATQHNSHEKRAPSDSNISHSRSKSDDGQDIGLSITDCSHGKAVSAPRALFQKNTEISSLAESSDLGNVLIHRTLSEPIAAPGFEKNELAPVVGPTKVVLCWQGQLDAPIRSLSSPGWGSPQKEEGQMKGALLVVGTEHRQRESASQDPMNGMFPSVPHHSLSPAISLEVIDVTLAEKYWRQIKKSHHGHSLGTCALSSNDENDCVFLHDCSIWPAAGKEIKDGWIRASLRRGIDPRDKLYEMLGLQRTSVTNRICCFEGPDSCFVSASSDGTVTISHYHPEHGSWGVMEEDNQIMLFQRCIGIGTCDYGGSDLVTSNLNKATSGAKRYAVCCLRGGTICLVPVAEQDTSDSTRATGSNDITTFAVPVDPDGDDDGLVRFVQNFTAGMARILNWRDHSGTDKSHLTGNGTLSSMKSVALVGWPGGYIDVYEVAPGKPRSTTLIEKIIDRGVVTKLVQRLLEISKSHSLISSDLWRRAWDECHEGNNNICAILEGVKDSSTTDFVAMRSLLTSLARKDS